MTAPKPLSPEDLDYLEDVNYLPEGYFERLIAQARRAVPNEGHWKAVPENPGSPYTAYKAVWVPTPLPSQEEFLKAYESALPEHRTVTEADRITLRWAHAQLAKCAAPAVELPSDEELEAEAKKHRWAMGSWTWQECAAFIRSRVKPAPRSTEEILAESSKLNAEYMRDYSDPESEADYIKRDAAEQKVHDETPSWHSKPGTSLLCNYQAHDVCNKCGWVKAAPKEKNQ